MIYRKEVTFDGTVNLQTSMLIRLDPQFLQGFESFNIIDFLPDEVKEIPIRYGRFRVVVEFEPLEEK